MLFTHFFKKNIFCNGVESWHLIRKARIGNWHSTLQKSSNLFRRKAVISPRNPFMKWKEIYMFFLWFASLCSSEGKLKGWKPASVSELSSAKLYETKHVIDWLWVGGDEGERSRERSDWGGGGWSWKKSTLRSLLPAYFSFKNKFLQLANSPQLILIVRMNTYQK